MTESLMVCIYLLTLCRVEKLERSTADPPEYDLENVCWRSKKNQTLFYVSLIYVTKGLAYESEYFEQLVKNV